MSTEVLPPPASSPNPLFETWESRKVFFRCHNIRFGATEFNPGMGKGRFHPFLGLGGRRRRVPTLYAADSLAGALSETIFHNLPVRGPDKAIRRSLLLPMVVSGLIVNRDLALVQLYGYGLRRLEVSRAELIESEADQYGQTAAWAQALHAHDKKPDGLVWVSRQYDASLALVLFGDRVSRGRLEVVEAPLPLYLGPGFDEVQKAADAAGITILE